MEVTIKDFDYKPSTGNFTLNNNGKKGLLLIYAPWCGFCQMLTPEWKKFYQKNKEKYIIKALNVENKNAGNKRIVEKLNIQGFPTIKFIHTNGKIGENYSNERNIENFEKYLSQK
jgi:thiol-disulfide isomerase/thioredoxin